MRKIVWVVCLVGCGGVPVVAPDEVKRSTVDPAPPSEEVVAATDMAAPADLNHVQDLDHEHDLTQPVVVVADLAISPDLSPIASDLSLTPDLSPQHDLALQPDLSQTPADLSQSPDLTPACGGLGQPCCASNWCSQYSQCTDRGSSTSCNAVGPVQCTACGGNFQTACKSGNGFSCQPKNVLGSSYTCGITQYKICVGCGAKNQNCCDVAAQTCYQCYSPGNAGKCCDNDNWTLRTGTASCNCDSGNTIVGSGCH